MTTVAELTVPADVANWRRIGLPADTSDAARIGSVVVRFVEPVSPEAVLAWTLRDAPTTTGSIDGLPTRHTDAAPVTGEPVAIDGVVLDVVGFDHLVVQTNDLERTCQAIEQATGAPLKRIREVGSLRQGFHRLGEVIVEVVTHPGVVAETAEFWGFVINVANLDEAAAHLGPDVLSPPKDAVQPGRRIASFRAEAGLGLPVALMTGPAVGS